MSIRPVDMQIALPKSSEVNHVNNNTNNRHESQQQIFSQHMQKQVELSQQQVIQSGKTEGQTVDKDGSNNSGGYQSKKKRKEAEAKKKANASLPYEDKGMLDIKV